jgi:hypothetical protein
MRGVCLAVVVALAVPLAAWGQAMSPMGQPPVTSAAETAHYKLTLTIGASEKMYSKDEAARMHPTSGEVMVKGTMASMGMGGMAGMTASIRHLELHVVDRATGKVVRDATVSITVTNEATRKTAAVPVAVMYGVKEGPADWHYGNNVELPPGRYTVVAVVNGERAVFHVTVPGAM